MGEGGGVRCREGGGEVSVREKEAGWAQSIGIEEGKARARRRRPAG